jgi:hypothetical protein
MLGKPSRRTRKRLDERGVRASAEVLEISQRGMAVTSGSGALVSDTEVALKTRLRVDPEGQPSFEVEQRFRYSQFGVPVVGMRIGVIFDPEDHETIELDRFASKPDASAVASGIGGSGGSGGMDLGGLLASVQAAKAESHGDPQAMAAALQAKLGGQTPIVMAAGAAGSSANAGGEDPVEQLTKLADLRDRGVLSDEEFATQKARILGES